MRERGVLGTVTWGYVLAGESKNGLPEAADARAALADAIRHRAAAEKAAAEATIKAANTKDRTNPKYVDFVKYWLEKRASWKTSPRTYERYTDFARYLNRYIGETRISGLTTAQIQHMIHRLEDGGGMLTKDHPNGRPLAPKTVRHIGTMLYTSLAEADRLGILTVRHPMANRRVKLPKCRSASPRSS
jgi:Phage integrase, N-terminal SAM-like domain